jgi:hypothetical protein
MANDEQEQDRSRHGHHGLLAICRLPKSGGPAFGKTRERCTHAANLERWITWKSFTAFDPAPAPG